MLVFALLIGTAWTGRASVARVDVDPALHAGDVALIQVAAGTAWTIAADLTSAGATDVTAYDSLDIVSARVSDAALAMIRTDRSALRATTDAAIIATGGGRNRDLDQVGDSSDSTSIGNAAIGAPSAWSRSTGAGVVVALIDSGIAQHPDLPAGKVVARVNFVNDDASSLDPAGHGTHLAGIIAANGASFRGVAPDARLVDLRVLDKNGNGRLRDVVAAFDWLLKHRKQLDIGVLNLSIGTTQTSSYHADLLAALAEAAWFSGVAVVAAAGNDGPVGGRLSTPGADPFVITVGSFDDQGTVAEQDDHESLFSSRGLTLDRFAKPDVLAPGRRVVSLRADPTPRIDTSNKDSGDRGARNENQDNSRGRNAAATVSFDSTLYMRMSGTSVSSAMAAGVAALVLSHHRDYSPTKVKGALVGSGRGVSGSPRQAVDAMKALSASTRGVNKGLLPSRLLMQTLVKSGVASNGTTWEGVTWDGVTWEGVTWESVTWEGVSWESVTWESVSWEGVAWEQTNVTQHSAGGTSR